MTTTIELSEQLRLYAIEGTQTGTARFVQQRAADLLEAQAEQIEALQADAERYRWLRYEAQYCDEVSPVCVSNGNTQGHAQVILSEEELDAAIDAARKGNV